jgi:hypothetical protein
MEYLRAPPAMEQKRLRGMEYLFNFRNTEIFHYNQSPGSEGFADGTSFPFCFS